MRCTYYLCRSGLHLADPSLLHHSRTHACTGPLPPSLPSLARRYMPPELLSFGFGGAEAHPDLAFATTPTMQANSSIVGTSTAASARDIQGRAPTDSIDNMTMTDVETGVGIASQDLRGLMLSHQSGTYPARAPETPGSARYDGRAWDVYSMGASLFAVPPHTYTGIRTHALCPRAPLHSTPFPLPLHLQAWSSSSCGSNAPSSAACRRGPQPPPSYAAFAPKSQIRCRASSLILFSACGLGSPGTGPQRARYPTRFGRRRWSLPLRVPFVAPAARRAPSPSGSRRRRRRP